MARNLMWIGVLLFAVSWFLPVVSAQGDAPFGAQGLKLYDGPHGWQAFRFAWDLLQDEAGVQPGASNTKRLVLGATSLTNGVMLLSVLSLFFSLRAVPRFLGWLLLVCAALNLSWIYLAEGDFVSSLRVGYYLWVGSFVVTGFAALRNETV
jgi:hypothetical protein